VKDWLDVVSTSGAAISAVGAAVSAYFAFYTAKHMRVGASQAVYRSIVDLLQEEEARSSRADVYQACDAAGGSFTPVNISFSSDDLKNAVEDVCWRFDAAGEMAPAGSSMRQKLLDKYGHTITRLWLRVGIAVEGWRGSRQAARLWIGFEDLALDYLKRQGCELADRTSHHELILIAEKIDWLKAH
jgi:hypothetical protein